MLEKHILTGVFVLLLPVTLLAQTNATVGGTVGDAAGAVIPGVEVTARNVNTGIVSNQLTNETGTYNFASLQPGTYTFSASLPGFQTQTFQNVTLSQTQQVRLNFTLEVAGRSQTVEVVTDANVILATTTASVGDVLPEVEVRLQTRSGTNQFHGALFYANNNSALNAKDWFDNLKGAQKSYLNRTQYGGRLGGPIIKNKAFFFVLIDNQRYLAKQSFVTNVFTDLARQGIFRYSPGQRNANAQAARPSVDLAGNPLVPVTSFNLFTDVRDPFRTGMTTVPYWRDLLTKHMPLANDFTVGDGPNIAGIRWNRLIHGLNAGNRVGNDNNSKQLNARAV